MRVRRQGGATLGLVAACVFFVIVIGVGFYFLSKIIGGGREVANATDAGALNVARQAMTRGTATLANNDLVEFGGYAIGPQNNQITLLNYNRLVAQAMMVAANAEKLGTPTAKTNAQATANAVKAIGTQLKASLTAAAAGSLGGDFNAIASSNNTKMWNGNAVSCVSVTPGYLKQGGSTNVIFDSSTANSLNGFTPKHATVDLSASNQPNPADTAGFSVGSGGQYMPGYVANSFLGGTVSLTGVPVFPNTKPHLVDIGAFKQDLQNFNQGMAADNTIPPNAFMTNAQSLKGSANSGQSSVACAVVGVLTNDYKASFSRGFVRISNGPDAVQQNGSFGVPISDGTNDIFNNQLFNGNGITQDQNSSVFSTNQNYLTMWSNFNNRLGAYDNSADPANAQALANAGITSGRAYVSRNTNTTDGIAYAVGASVPLQDLPNSPDPLHDMADVNTASNFDANESGLRAGNNCNAPLASITDLEKIGLGGGSNFNCKYTMYDDGLTGPCAQVNNIQTWQSNYACLGLSTGGTVASTGAHQGMTNVEYMKAELLVKIAGRLGGSFCSDVSIPSSSASGVKLFPAVPGTPGSAVAFDPTPAPSPGSSPVLNFETVGSPYQYLNQISDSGNSPCAQGSTAILEQITNRIQQIDSSVTLAGVKAALQSQPLHLKGGSSSQDNGTLYLYVDSINRTLQMSATLPNGWSDSTAGNSSSFPDGPAPSLANGECTETYPLNGWVVDTSASIDGQTHGGDAHYHAEPFTQPAFAGTAPGGTYTSPAFANSADNGTSAPIYGQDAAVWKASSGSQNLLGELRFQENTQGTTFCKPN